MMYDVPLYSITPHTFEGNKEFIMLQRKNNLIDILGSYKYFDFQPNNLIVDISVLIRTACMYTLWNMGGRGEG